MIDNSHREAVSELKNIHELTDPQFRKTSLLVQKAVRTPPAIRWENQEQPHFAIESYVAAPPATFEALPMALIAIHYGRKLDAVVDNASDSEREIFTSIPYRLILLPTGAGTHWRAPQGTFWFQVIYTSGATQDALRKIIGNSRAPFQVRDRVLPALSRQLLGIATSSTISLPERYAERIIDAFTAQLEWLSCGNHSGEMMRTPDPAINEILLHIHSHANDTLTIAHLASLQRMSPALLRRRFQEAVGVPVHRYIIKCRVERAYELIEESRLSLTEIATQCGFSSLSHMSSAFTRILGCTPGEYRRRAATDSGRSG
ncbi:MAG: AraC family transcriptional regulator [Sterolibacterium sp.]|nr:AraC family transcriptional regulator [Sterolibacterium sp.]